MLYLEKEYLSHNFVRSMYYTDKKVCFYVKNIPQLEASITMAILVVRNFKNLAIWPSNFYTNPEYHILNEWQKP